MTPRGKAAAEGPKPPPRRSGSSPPRGTNQSGRARDGVETWRAGKQPILRFLLIFTVLAAPLFVFYYAYYERSGVLYTYLSLNAKASAAVMRCFGTPATANGITVRTPRFGLTVAQGCDAIQPIILFFCAVLASPVAWRLKLLGILIGVPSLLILNLARIVTLFYTGVYFPKSFELIHIDIWQAAFIFVTLLFWVLWARWARGRSAVGAHVSP
jgi:exosortase H (IPTLxxWG-CTERM-specific)